MKKSRVLSEKEQVWQQNLAKIWFAKKKELGLTQESAAAKAGWKTQSAFSQFLNGGVALNIEAIIKIASALEVHPAEIAPELASLNTKKNAASQFANIETRLQIKGRVPLISWGQAGDWCEAHDPYPVGDAEMWLPAADNYGENAYALRVRGASMEPRFREGEIIVINPDGAPNSGKFVIARKEGSKEVTFKQLIREGDEAYLKAINPQWPEPIIRMDEAWHICGVVVCKMEIF